MANKIKQAILAKLAENPEFQKQAEKERKRIDPLLEEMFETPEDILKRRKTSTPPMRVA